MSSTSEVTILPNAPPITTPTARSMTLPLMANSLNSLIKLITINSKFTFHYLLEFMIL
ncbi:hypothetical protein D3C72_1640890 [compost metagenome]